MRPLPIHSALILQWRMPRPPVMLFVCPIDEKPSIEHRAWAQAQAWAWAWAIIMADDSAIKSAMGTGQSLERIMRGQSLRLRLFKIIAAPLPRRVARYHSQQKSRLQETGQRESRALVGQPRTEPHNREVMRRTRRQAPRCPLRNQQRVLWGTAISRHLRQATRRHGRTRLQANTQARRATPRKPL